jgi:Zn-dependent protease with chaperone function
MAHETGHVVARHAARNLVTAYGLDAVTAPGDTVRLSVDATRLAVVPASGED